MTIPNAVTLLRIALVPIMVFFYYLPVSWSHYAAAGIFVAASLTDWADGFLARKLDQVSKLGEFLDPVADKLIVAVALVMVVAEVDIPYLALPAAVIVGREIVISALREWMAELGKRSSVAVSMVGKIKTTAQMLAVVLLLAYQPGMEVVMKLGVILLYIAAFLTLWSMIVYCLAAWRVMRKGI